jgi:rod shape-determining protein MreB
VQTGSFDIDTGIQNYVRREYGIAIGERTAEEIKMAIGSAAPTPDEVHAEVRGRDLMSGLPKTVVLSPAEVRGAIDEVTTTIVDSVIRCLSKAPPELSQDFLVRSIHLRRRGSAGPGQRIGGRPSTWSTSPSRPSCSALVTASSTTTPEGDVRAPAASG